MLHFERLMALTRARHLRILADLLDQYGAPAESVRATTLQAECEEAAVRGMDLRAADGAQGVGPWSARDALRTDDSLSSGGLSDWPSVARPGSFYPHQTDESERRAIAALAEAGPEI